MFAHEWSKDANDHRNVFSLQERFHGIVPVLSKWSGTIVGFTLIAIGLLGMYESWFAHHEAMPEPVAFAGRHTDMILES